MINYIKGDLFEVIKLIEAPIVIPHVVNNQGAFSLGFVVALARHFPIAKSSYFNWCKNPEFGLGQTFLVPVVDNITVAHMCAQTLGGSRPLYYNALARCMDEVGVMATECKAAIHAPAFGSKLAGGNWHFIEQLIQDCWIRDKNLDVTIYYFA